MTEIDINRPRRTCKIPEGQFMPSIRWKIKLISRFIEYYISINDTEKLLRMWAQALAIFYSSEHRKFWHNDFTHRDEMEVKVYSRQNLLILEDYYNSKNLAHPSFEEILIPMINKIEFEE